MRIHSINGHRKGPRSIWVNIPCIYHRGTTTPPHFTAFPGELSWGIRYLLRGQSTRFFTVVSLKAQSLLSLRPHSAWKENRGSQMSEQSCRCTAANNELHSARHAYETRTATSSKRKLAELNAKVKLEEGSRSEEDIAAAVDWLEDAGTSSKWATQFTRTKVESWRVKTLLAKALEAMEEKKAIEVKEFNLTEAQMSQIIDYHNALAQRISLLQGEVETITKMLTVLIQILKNVVHPDRRQPQPAQPAQTVVQDNVSLENIQAQVEKHVFEVGMDKVTFMGKRG